MFFTKKEHHVKDVRLKTTTTDSKCRVWPDDYFTDRLRFVGWQDIHRPGWEH